jgi:hypothetical protein
MLALILIASVYALALGHYSVTILGLLAAAMCSIPTIVQRKLNIIIPWEVTFLVALTLFLHTGGFSFKWYLDYYPFYDKLAHLMAAITVAFAIFLAVLIILRISYRLEMERWQIFLFVVILTFTFGVIWEIWEFIFDTFLGSVFTIPLQRGNSDTLLDLASDLAGGMIVAFLGTYFLKRKGAHNWADTFLNSEFGKNEGPSS